METAASLKQTITHLFDAVRFADRANELEESARNVEGDLEASLNKLEAHTEEVSTLLAGMKVDGEPVLKELAQQVGSFLETAEEQAKNKLQKNASQQLEDYRSAIASERDKALKSIEAYFASDPLPIIENVVQVKLVEGIYEARSRCECEGGIRYDFRLAAQNSKIFNREFSLSQLGHEIRVPVRFSRGLLSKNRTPGFERLDQYVLVDAEASGEKLRSNFEKSGTGAKIKVVTSGNQQEGFVSIEYSDQLQSVNVMNDPSLVAFVEVEALKGAAWELVNELNDLSKRKVALLSLSFNGDRSAIDINYRVMLEKVLDIMGPAYRSSIVKMASGEPAVGEEGMDLDYIRGRMKVLGGDLSKTVSQTLGVKTPQ